MSGNEITLAMLDAAIRNAADVEARAAAKAQDAFARFLLSLPAGLRANPEVLSIAERLRRSWLGDPLHPDDARRMEARVRALLDAAKGRRRG